MKTAVVILIGACLYAESLRVPLGLDAYIPAPDDNPLTREKVQLGRALFFDTSFSKDHSVSCATCHDPKRGFTDGRSTARGVRGQIGERRTPPLFNRAFGQSFFWDGRAATLEEQVLQPMLNPKEMDLAEADIETRAGMKHRESFRAVFGRDVKKADVGRALASYVRSILAGNSPYDRYIAGDRSALNSKELEGLRLFRGKANCIACHMGPNLTDESFHNTGSAWRDGKYLDLGREQITKNASERGAFKTPGLREVARTAPYMHDGSLAKLEDVVRFYEDGGRANPNLDPEIRPLKLTAAERESLVVFLGALTGTVQEGW